MMRSIQITSSFVYYSVACCKSVDAEAKQVIICLFDAGAEAPLRCPPGSFYQNKGEPGQSWNYRQQYDRAIYRQQFVRKIHCAAGRQKGRCIQQNIGDQYQLVVVNLPADHTINIADLPAAKQKLLFDVATVDDACATSNAAAMFCISCPTGQCADALARIYENADRVVFGVGATQEDRLFAEAIVAGGQAFRHKDS
jgi:hypothetical protein